MLELIVLSLGLSCVTAVASLILGKARAASKTVACVGGMAAAVAGAAGGIMALFGPAVYVSLPGPMPFTDFTLLLNPLAGLLVAVIAVLAFAAWLYGLSYFDEYYDKGIGVIGFFMNLFIASMDLVILVDNAFWFLVFFELMSLTSYVLVIIDQTEKSLRGGFLYLVMAHIGFLMIALSFFTMAVSAGSLEFMDYRTCAFAPATATIAFVLAFFGFGAKAGMVPFHSWLPQAHPAAPSNVSALMSGGMIKIGIFGMLKVCFDLLGATGGQVGWGVLVIVIGAASSVLGVVYALGEHDLKSLLAYHSVENIGIILLGVGTGIYGWAAGLPWVAGIGLLAGLYHLVNHAMFKGLLFLGAGSVLHATGTRNMEVLGGLARLMPWTAACFLVGSLAISAIPPLNGFVSEWFTYQGLIGAAMEGDLFLRIVFAFAVVALAITGALAVTCVAGSHDRRHGAAHHCLRGAGPGGCCRDPGGERHWRVPYPGAGAAGDRGARACVPRHRIGGVAPHPGGAHGRGHWRVRPRAQRGQPPRRLQGGPGALAVRLRARSVDGGARLYGGCQRARLHGAALRHSTCGQPRGSGGGAPLGARSQLA